MGLWGLSVLLPSAEDVLETSADNVTALTYQSSVRFVSLPGNGAEALPIRPSGEWSRARLPARNGVCSMRNGAQCELGGGRVMEMFLFNQINVLVTTPRATRGLDFPNVTHVFNLGIVGTDADYLHRAGRVGRIGQACPGVVMSVLQASEACTLKELGARLKARPCRPPTLL